MDPTDRPLRLFLAVPLTHDIRAGLQAQLQPLSLPGRVVPPENWHITLAFLGNISTEALERLRDALLTTDLGPRCTISFDHLGAFPRPARATVLWVGVTEGAEAMQLLAERARAAIGIAGLLVEAQAFVPHLTISRIQPPRDVRRVAAQAPPFVLRMPVEAVVLFCSHLGGGPARYEEVERFPLAANA